MLFDNSDKKQCPKYAKNSRCIPKCGAPGGQCNEKHTVNWCPLKLDGDE